MKHVADFQHEKTSGIRVKNTRKLLVRHNINRDLETGQLTKNDAKCSDVMTALKPTTGTKAASNVPKTTWIQKFMVLEKKMIDQEKNKQI